jgi:hypothetical protein
VRVWGGEPSRGDAGGFLLGLSQRDHAVIECGAHRSPQLRLPGAAGTLPPRLLSSGRHAVMHAGIFCALISPMVYPPHERMVNAVRIAQRQKFIRLGLSLLAPLTLFAAIAGYGSADLAGRILWASMPRFRPFYLASFVITYWLLRRAEH